MTRRPGSDDKNAWKQTRERAVATFAAAMLVVVLFVLSGQLMRALARIFHGREVHRGAGSERIVVLQ